MESVGTLPETAVREMAVQILMAVNDLHKLKMCHGTICPSQILLDRTGNIKVELFVDLKANLDSFLWLWHINYSQKMSKTLNRRKLLDQDLKN